MSKPKSNTLFHFTKTNDVLCNILKNGFFPRYSIEEIKYLDGIFEKVAIPVVCFCDIPLSRISDHVDFYGHFGLGMTREWCITNGLNPVQYVTSNSLYLKNFKAIWIASIIGERSDIKDTALASLISMYSFHKPLFGEVVITGKPIEKEFYQESEWRYLAVPKEHKFIFDDKIVNDTSILKKHNDRIQNECALRFTPKDIKYIFVKSDSDIPDVVNFINKELDIYPSADLKILLSRITSLGAIEADI